MYTKMHNSSYKEQPLKNCLCCTYTRHTSYTSMKLSQKFLTRNYLLFHVSSLHDGNAWAVKILQQLTSLDVSYLDIHPNRVTVSQSWANILHLVLISIVKKWNIYSVRNLSNWPMSYLRRLYCPTCLKWGREKRTIIKFIPWMFWNGDWGFARTGIASDEKFLGWSSCCISLFFLFFQSLTLLCLSWYFFLWPKDVKN